MSVTIVGRSASTTDVHLTGRIEALIDSEADLIQPELQASPPGSVAYSADGALFKVKNNAGAWVDFGSSGGES